MKKKIKNIIPNKNNKKTIKIRIDEVLVKLNLASDLDRAKKLILSGLVKVNNQVIDKVGTKVNLTDEIVIKETTEYVSRGANKIKSVIEQFKINTENKICADVGSSTGGFTQVLLNKNAKKVYAIDVGYGELDWRLRSDSRVVVMERTNARNLESLPEKIDFCTIDVSFISLKNILPSVFKWLSTDAQVLALIKPQFEIEKGKLEKGGIIKDRNIHKQILEDILAWLSAQEINVVALTKSPLPGMKGNQEFFVLLDTAKRKKGVGIDFIGGVFG